MQVRARTHARTHAQVGGLGAAHVEQTIPFEAARGSVEFAAVMLLVPSHRLCVRACMLVSARVCGEELGGLQVRTRLRRLRSVLLV